MARLLLLVFGTAVARAISIGFRCLYGSLPADWVSVVAWLAQRRWIPNLIRLAVFVWCPWKVRLAQMLIGIRRSFDSVGSPLGVKTAVMSWDPPGVGLALTGWGSLNIRLAADVRCSIQTGLERDGWVPV